MPRPRPAEQPKVVKIEVPENVAEYYTNNFNMGFTNVDFVLFFSSLGLPNQLVSKEAHLAGTIKAEAVIRMSPQHVKLVARVMQQTISEYERQFGAIADVSEKGAQEKEDATPSQ